MELIYNCDSGSLMYPGEDKVVIGKDDGMHMNVEEYLAMKMDSKDIPINSGWNSGWNYNWKEKGANK